MAVYCALSRDVANRNMLRDSAFAFEIDGSLEPLAFVRFSGCRQQSVSCVAHDAVSGERTPRPAVWSAFFSKAGHACSSHGRSPCSSHGAFFACRLPCHGAPLRPALEASTILLLNQSLRGTLPPTVCTDLSTQRQQVNGAEAASSSGVGGGKRAAARP